MTLSELEIGQQATIEGFTEGIMPMRRFYEFGIIPGKVIKVKSKATLGDPILVECGTSWVALRRNEASQIRVCILQ